MEVQGALESSRRQNYITKLSFLKGSPKRLKGRQKGAGVNQKGAQIDQKGTKLETETAQGLSKEPLRTRDEKVKQKDDSRE